MASSLANVKDFSGLVRSLVDAFTVERLAQETDIPIEDLQRFCDGGNHYLPWHEEALYGFSVAQQKFDLLGQHASVLPLYNLKAINRREPSGVLTSVLDAESDARGLPLINRPTSIVDKWVDFPFGVSACNASAVYPGLEHSRIIAFYAARGFDFLTYHTVRSAKREALDKPNWVFVDSGTVDNIPPDVDLFVVADPNYAPTKPRRVIDPRYVVTANSLGNPSLDPARWMQDVDAAKRTLRSGHQLLAVSVVATEEKGDPREGHLIEDFVRVALLAKEAGASIIEANYSCPNVPNDRTGDLYRDPILSGKISAAIKKALGDTPLFVKIGYLNKDELAEFVRSNRAHVQGIVAINAIPMQLVSPNHSPLFPGRVRAGISGAAIRSWTQKAIDNLTEIRGPSDDFVIVGVGGVCTPRDIDDLRNRGADIVLSCTAAAFNPNLAIDARLQVQQLLEETQGDPPRRDVPDIAAGTRGEARSVKAPDCKSEKSLPNQRDTGDDFTATVDAAEHLFSEVFDRRIESKFETYYTANPGLRRLTDQDSSPLPEFDHIFENLGQRRIAQALDTFYRERPALKRP